MFKLLQRILRPTARELAERQAQYQADLRAAELAGDLPPLRRPRDQFGNVIELNPRRKRKPV